MRKAAKHIKLLIIFIVFISNILTKPLQCAAIPVAPKITAEAAILIDEQSGTILMQKNKDNKIYCPLANELMTILLAIEKGSFNSNITISKNAAFMYGSSFYLEAGEIIPFEDLVHAAMLRTSNDALVAIAEHIGGSVENFIKLMNDRATELNMKNTVFVNPTGAYDIGNTTTAGDMAILLKTALAKKSFKDMMLAQFKSLNRDSEQQIIVNQNQLLFTQNEEVTGGKSQNPNYSSPQSAITLATKQNLNLVAVILRASYDNVFNDTLSILGYGFNNFKKDILVSKGEKITSILVEDKAVSLVASDTVYYVFPLGEIHISNIRFSVPATLSLPIGSNVIAGNAIYEMKDGTVIDVKLYPDKDYYPESGIISELIFKLEENKEIALFLAILLFIESVILLFSIIKLIRKRLNY